MTETVASASVAVAVIYVLIGILIFPGIRFSGRVLFGSVMFFLGCAGTHLVWSAGLLLGHADHGFVLMLFLHAAQIVGGAMFIREMQAKRLVVKVERD